MRNKLNVNKSVAFCTLVLMLVLIVFTPGRAVRADSTQKQFVYDFSDVLSSEDEKELEAIAHEVSEKTELDLIVVFVDQKLNTEKKITDYGDGFYDTHAFGYDRPHGNGMILVIDTKARNYYVGTSGSAFDFFSESRLDAISDKIVNQLSKNNWKGGAHAYLQYVEQKYHDPHRSYTMGERVKASAQRTPIYLVISIGVSALIILIMVKNRANKVTANSNTYLRPGSFMLLQNEDAFVGETTTRIRRVQASSGGGRSGGGGGAHISSGGFSHGGRAGKF